MTVVQVTVADGSLPIESDDRVVFVVPEEGEGTFEANLPDSLRQVTRTLGEFIQDTCAQVHAAVDAAVQKVQPSGAEVTFAIGVGGEAGIPFVAKGTAEGSIKITLKWDFKEGAAPTNGPDPGHV